MRLLKQLIIVLAFFVALCSPAASQFNGCAAGFCSPSSSYIGPGDVVSGATEFYGLRAYNKAYATGTNNAITIRRTSDSTSTNILILATGALDVATATTFCASTTCFASAMYGQISGKIVTQATTSAQPQLIFNCLNTSLPCLALTSASSQQLTTSSFVTSAQPNTLSFVAERNGNTGVTNSVIGAFNASQGGYGAAANQAFIFAGSQPTVTAADNALHAVQGVLNGASSSLNVDGTLTGSLSVGSNSIQPPLAIGSSGNNGNYLQGLFAEAIVYEGVAMTSGNQTALCHNQRLYYGLGGSC
jgi:hypothetical protein